MDKTTQQLKEPTPRSGTISKPLRYGRELSGYPFNAFEYKKPWFAALAGRRVLFIFPFVDTARSQYRKRKALFPAGRCLPEFELLTYRPFVTQGGNAKDSPYGSWFETLDRMIDEIGSLDFDVAVIGAGAYGMPIAAAVKRLGKVAVHVGGAVQVYFGIKGGRWDADRVGRIYYNDAWTRPFSTDVSAGMETVERGCYI